MIDEKKFKALELLADNFDTAPRNLQLEHWWIDVNVKPLVAEIRRLRTEVNAYKRHFEELAGVDVRDEVG